VSLFLPLLTLALLTYGGWLFLQELRMTPPPSASAPAAVSAADDLRALISALATPQKVEVTLPDTLVVVTPSPIPLPTRPPVTTVGVDLCTDNTRAGTVCVQPKPPPPLPTEVPDCPVNVGSKCVGTGKPVTWLPTPVPGTMASYVPGGPNQ
jgi:hypothetical protein